MRALYAIAAIGFGLGLAACTQKEAAAEPQETAPKAMASDYLESEIPEQLAQGFQWSEGPVWIKDGGYLLFSDTRGNVVYKWTEGGRAEPFLDPSGFAGPITEDMREPGINGMVNGPAGTIYAADHGNRAIVQVDLATKKKTIVVDNYQGKKFSSPNDLALASDGSIYFTDPPYGLTGLNDSPLKELDFNGVYRLSPDGELSVLDDTLTFPNGVILSPDEKTLYVAVSDPQGAIWVAYDRAADGSVSNKRVFHDATAKIAAGAPGLPDGMCMASTGELVSVGPGGLYIFPSEDAEPVIVDLGGAAANCAFGEDGHSIFITAGDRLLRFRTKLLGKGF